MEATMVRKTFKYKLKPTAEQVAEFERVLTLCRHLYNVALEQRKIAWARRGVTVTREQQNAELPGLKAALPDYAGVNAQVLQDVTYRLDRTFRAFFRRCATGERPGYPRFKGAGRYNSFTYPQVGRGCGARFDNGFLVLAKIGRVALRWSRPLEGTPKTVTISREADGWYACFSCADVPVQPLPPTGQETGVDLGLESFATLSDGAMIHNPRYYRKAERALKTAQRRVSRRKKGSNRRRKAVQLLAKAHLTVKQQRADFHHKTALTLVRQYDTIYHEDLQTKRMLKNHHVAKSIGDAGWYTFLTILAFKAECAGKRAIAVTAAYTSQTCSNCGVLVPKAMGVRWHSCPDCGTSLHRDHNAAKNIERAGQALRGGVALAAS